MQLRYHAAASIIVSAAAYAVSDSAAMAAVTLASGIFMDADHLIDYLVFYRPPYGIQHFFDTYYQNRLTHVFLLLHAWELIGILALAAVAFDGGPVATGLLIGMGHHLLLDQIFNEPRPLGYFLTYRLFARFSYERCFYRAAETLHKEKSP